MNNCLQCDQQTENSKFCNRSCAAKFNNKKYPKRKSEGLCAKCNKAIPRRHKYCIDCRLQHCFFEQNKSIKELFIYGHHRSSIYVKIRHHSRKVVKERLQICQKCGWDKHVECCHIKSISDFSEDTLISTVNHPDNLILLCPNCHWVFGHKV